MKKLIATAGLVTGLLVGMPHAHAQYPPTTADVGNEQVTNTTVRSSALPRTGSDDTFDGVAIGATSIGVGALLVLAKRRRASALAS